MVKSAPQNNQTVIAIQQDCLKVRCCNLHFILIYFCICKSTYISKMLFCIQNFVIYIYEHNNINIYLCVHPHSALTHRIHYHRAFLIHSRFCNSPCSLLCSRLLLHLPVHPFVCLFLASNKKTKRNKLDFILIIL